VSGICSLHTSRPAQGPTQLPIQSVPGVKWPGPRADHSPPSSVEVMNACKLYFPLPVHLHSVGLNEAHRLHLFRPPLNICTRPLLTLMVLTLKVLLSLCFVGLFFMIAIMLNIRDKLQDMFNVCSTSTNTTQTTCYAYEL
jgi:hypothetical protein